MSTLDTDRIRTALDELDGWQLDGDRLVRELRFDSFRDAIAFINRVADLADAANHHPELTNVYSRVTVVLTTHDAGGVTQKDLDLARAIDAVVT
jgi:4a-hydroxytetrahydrobiopterin dehydratase